MDFPQDVGDAIAIISRVSAFDLPERSRVPAQYRADSTVPER
jgi:hypothetical protein